MYIRTTVDKASWLWMRQLTMIKAYETISTALESGKKQLFRLLTQALINGTFD
jgi:hypothetical protein